MNKNCYRIVFNKARALLMAVSETAASQGKASGETSAQTNRQTTHSSSQHPHAAFALLKPLTFFVWSVLGLVMTSASHAQVVADPNAPGNQRPTVLTAPNNVPLVNIQTPSAAGVSRNTYSQFDVQKPGAILNNSVGSVQTQLGGLIQGNPWLGNGSARVILNEVNSNNPSLLRGYVEVAGQRAQVIIANPAGVSCDGCGFINANRATITTGTPLLNSGNLEGFRVQGGTVSITGKGMDASTTDYTDIIARAVHINGGIWAKQLKIVAGTNEVSVDPANGDTGVVNPIASTGTAPAFAIDSSLLGGMYAGKITLLATEAGVGVSNAGKLYASVGNVVITANGQLQNAGHINSTSGQTQIDTQNGIQNTGIVYAHGNTELSTRGNIDNMGVVAALGNTSLNATGSNSQITSGQVTSASTDSTDTSNTGTNNSGPLLGAGIQTDFSLGTTGNLTVNATQFIAAQGQNMSGGDQVFTSKTIDLSRSKTSANNLSATASQTLRTDRASIVATQIAASAYDVSNVNGDIVQMGSGDIAFNLEGNLDNTQGRIATNSANMSIAANTLTNTGGKLEHAGTGVLDLHANTLNGTHGTIASNGTLNLKATSATLNAANTSARQLNINSATLSHQGGTLTQKGSGNITIAASNQLDNTGGNISSSGSTTLTVGALKNQGGTIETSGSIASDLTLTAAAEIDSSNAGMLYARGNASIAAGNQLDNSGGNISSNGSATLTVGALKNQGGIIQAFGSTASDLTLTAAAQIDNSNTGRIYASGNASIAGDSLNNTQGQITAGQLLTAATTQATTNSQGLIAANGQVSVNASQVTNQNGTIGSVQDAVNVTARTGTLDNTSGRIEAAKTATVAAVGITNTDGTITGKSLSAKSLSANNNTQAIDNTRGKLIASGTAVTDTLNIQSAVLTNASGAIVGQRTVNLSTGDFNNQAGYVGSNAALTINGAAITNTQGGNIVSSATATINANSLNNQGGQLQAVDNVDITLSGALNNTQSIVRSAQNLSIHAASVNNNNTQGTNQGLEGHNITLTASDITNTDGTLLAGQQLTVNSDSLLGAGQIVSLGNLNIHLTQSHTNAGQILANGNATVETDATFINQGTIAAGNKLNLKAATIDNQASGTITASTIQLQATDSHTLTNRGLINGNETVLETQVLNNLGTGKIYGDHLAISASTLNNLAEDANGQTQAPVIAARNRLDIAANEINNSEHAILFSAGDLAIGASLDTNKHATGQATTLNNTSATIEALGSADINARTINNTNAHFIATAHDLPAQDIHEYEGSGSPNRYIPGTPDVYIFNDESDHLHTPEGNYESWSSYDYTRKTKETQVDSSDPARILSGQSMRISADTVNNDKSHIIAGATLTGVVGTLNNTEVAGERVIEDIGTATSFWRDHHKGRDSTGMSTAAYTPAPTIQSISLTPTLYQQNTAPNGTGTQVAALSTVTINQSPQAASSTSVSNSGTLQGGQVISPITQIVLPTSTPTGSAGSSANSPVIVVRTGGINTSLPNNSLFAVTPKISAQYLIETDPAFTNYRTWLSSDYLLKALSIDPALTQKRLGDGFYEQKLIREQIAQLTGKRLLDGYSNDEAQYAALMNSGASFASAYKLAPGVALSAAQMAQLTNDIVWLVEKNVTLPNGNTSKVLVPQLYVRVKEGDLQTGGALIAGSNINLNITGDLLNSGTIAGRQVLALTADNINNLNGRILANETNLAARTDLNNIGGTITAENSLAISAGRDLNVTSTTRTQTNAQGSRTNIERIAGLYVTGTAGTLLASAGRDVNLNAAAIENAAPANTTSANPASAQSSSVAGAASVATDNTAILASNNINLGTVTQSSSNKIVWGANNQRSDSSQVDTGTNIQTQGNLSVQAGKDLNAKAANLSSTQGQISATAGNNINLNAGQTKVQVDEMHQHKGRSSAFSSTTTTTRDTLDQTTAQATTLSGQTVTVQAGQDINLTGSNVVSDQGTTLAAQNNLNIQSATNTTLESHLRDEKKSGLFSSGGLGITLGTQQQSTDQQSTTQTAAASTIGSTQGDITLQAGKNYTQTGSDILAPQADIRIAAQAIDILEARETSNTQIESKFKQSGITAAISSPVISAVQTAQQMRKAADDTSDPRMKALAAANIAFAGNNAADAIKAGQGTTITDANGTIKEGQIITKTNPNGSVAESRDATAVDKIGGINLNISLGSTSSQSKTTETRDTARQSSIAAGNSLTITASGAGKQNDKKSDLTVQGSTLQAGKQIILTAEDEIKLLAAQNTAEQNSKNRSNSGSVGFSVGSNGLAVTAAASQGRGNADGNDLTWTNTQVNAGNQITLNSGGDTTVKGAVVAAPQITANVGGNLNIESLQDTSHYASKQSNVGGSVSIGASVSGNINASKSNTTSNFASVAEQSGLKAGDEGFNINVANNTDLKAGAITSTQQAIDNNKNTFSTGGQLTTSDLQNQANYQASSIGVNIGTGVSQDGKLAPQGTGAGIGKDSGKAGSTSTAAISGIAGNKEARTGDAETGIARIFDADKVQKETNAQVQITQTFGREASKAVASYAASKINDIRAQQKAEAGKTDPDPGKLQTLREEQQKWEEGGAYRIALHTAVGGLTAGMPGAAGVGAASAIAPALNDLQDSLARGLENAGANEYVAKAAAQLIAGITAAGVASVASGGSTAGAATAFNADANNRQLHPTEEQWIKANAKKFAKEQGNISEEEAIKRLTEQALKDIDYLWRAQLSDGNDKSAEAFLANNKQTFINDLGEQQKLFTATGQQLFRPEMFADAADPAFYKKFAQSSISRPLNTSLIKELKDSGVDFKNGTIDLAKVAADNPGLVFGALLNAVKGLPGAVVDSLVETGHALGEGSAVAFNDEIGKKLNAIYGNDVSGYQQALLAIRTISALTGAASVAKAGGELTEASAKAVAKKLDEVKAAKAAEKAIADAKVKNNFYRDGAQFESNIVNGVAKANLRLEYEQASRDLLTQAQRMQARGMSEEQVARWAVDRRNQLKVEYRELTPPEMLPDIEARNVEKYHNPIGPNVEQLRAAGKSWQQIIEGAAKPDGKDFDFSPPGFNGSAK